MAAQGSITPQLDRERLPVGVWGAHSENRVTKRTPQPCALCLRTRPLCESHIIPEFFFVPIYDEKHRFIHSSTNPKLGEALLQKGVRERLLCSECEGRLSRWEAHGRGVIYGGVMLQGQKDDAGATLHGVDYTSFKLFEVSLLWRAGASTLPEFAAVRLGLHQERLRRLLYEGDPGKPNDYPCYLIFLPDEEERALWKQVVMAPDMVNTQGHLVGRFLLGGLFWLFFVSKHTKLPSPLLETGTLRINKATSAMMGYLHRFGLEITEARIARRRR